MPKVGGAEALAWAPRKPSGEARRRRDAILDAVGEAAERFLKAPNWEDAIHHVLDRLGRATEVSRVYIFENHTDRDGTLLTSQRFEWVAPGISPQQDNPDLQNFPWEAGGFGRWAETMGRGQPIFGHVREFPDAEREVLSAQDIRSIVAMPIYAGQTWWGFIGFDECLAERQWSAPEMDALRAASGILGAAIERQRSAERLQRRTRQQEALHRISTALARLDSPRELCETIVRAGREILGYPHMGIFLVDPKTGDRVLQAQSGWGDTPVGWRIPPGAGLTDQVVRTGEVRYWRDVTREPAYVAGLPGSRSELDVPIKAGAAVLGVLVAEDTRVDAFGADDEEVLLAAANQLAVALENARLFEESRRLLATEQASRAELAALYDLSRELADAKDLTTVLRLAARRAAETLHVTFARILLAEGPALVTRAAHPVRVLDRDLGVDRREPDAAHVCYQRCLEQPGPVVLHADSPEVTDQERRAVFLGLAKTVCLVPLRAGEHALGLLVLGEARSHHREPFSDRNVRLARGIGDQAASAIHRALLDQQTQRRLGHLAALRAVDLAINSSLNLPVTLQVLLHHALAQLRVDAAAVLLLNPHTHMLEYAAGHGLRTRALERARLRLGEGCAGRAALERRTVWADRRTGAAADVEGCPLPAEEGVVAWGAVPLVAKGQLKGVLEVFHRTPLEPDDEWLYVLDALAQQAAMAIDNAGLFDGLQRANVELALAYDSTLEGWARALELRDKETEGHTRRIIELTMRLARALEVREEDLVHVRRGALLHDIGKMGIPDSILLKPGPLTEEEWEIMRRHPVYAHELLSPIPYLRPALVIPYCHHEKWDGTGYPQGLRGEQIPLAARIFAVADVWDALRSERPYRPPWTDDQARQYIREQAGRHFDPRVVEAFLRSPDAAAQPVGSRTSQV